MSNQLTALLKAWQAGSDETDWVLGTVYKTEGSAYRKAGAMMLINGLGQQFGLLSGGCLEADIKRHARKVMQSGKVVMLVYDGSDEDDWSFQLGIGCGGKVYIMLQAITIGQDLGLGDMAAALARRQCGWYHQKIGSRESYFETRENNRRDCSFIEHRSDGEWLVSPIQVEPHLLVIGGGIDACPVVNIARQLGWRVTLVDPRSANAQLAYFAEVDTILRELGDRLSDYIDAKAVDAAVIMSHNVAIDAEGLRCCQQSRLGYVALLGPVHRYQKVLEQAGLSKTELCCAVSAPAGLDIGGQLPESIALSILSEAHSKLYLHKNQSALQLAVV